MLSIVIPTLDEADVIDAALGALLPLRARGAEVVIVDGGSADDTSARAIAQADHVLAAPRGRASQMNAGAAVASGDILLFLHVDTRLPDNALTSIERALSDTTHVWGRFDVRIDPPRRLLRLVAWSMNLRSRVTGIATGDQAIFVRREAFERAGGYPEIPLMEDVALSRGLKRLSRPVCLREHVVTSGRLWEKQGILRTIVLMWRLRFAFFLGADPAQLAARYGYARQS